MTSASLIAVFGVLLLSPFIQAGLNPVPIYEEISTGVRNDHIVFRDQCRGNWAHTLPDISRAAVCRKLVQLHDIHNKLFLGVSVTTGECISALNTLPLYTQQDLIEYCGPYCGTCSCTGFHNFECDCSPSTVLGPIYRIGCTHTTQTGTSTGYMEVEPNHVSNIFLLPKKLYNVTLTLVSVSSQRI